MKNAINPTHYNSTSITAWQVIRDWGLGFNVGNATKYIQRAGKKENADDVEDLEKAIRYLQEEVAWRKDAKAKRNRPIWRKVLDALRF